MVSSPLEYPQCYRCFNKSPLFPEEPKIRSHSELRQFVAEVIKQVRENKNERHKAILKRNYYKVFSDEIIPLSIFCTKYYPENYTVQPVLGNQAYDAIIESDQGKVVDFIELTLPHDGFTASKDAKLVVTRSYGEVDVCNPGEDLTRMFSIIQYSCNKKALNNYSNCILVIVINFSPPFERFMPLYRSHIAHFISTIKDISFNAKKVCLLVIPLDDLLIIRD